MQEVTLPIGKLFNLIESFETIRFNPEQEEFLKNPLYIRDENDDWVKINAGIIKQTTGRKIRFTNGDIIKAADKHLIFDGTQCVFLDDLNIGDTILKMHDEPIVVEDIEIIEDTLYYDLSVESDTHLYQTTNGIIHHNTELAKLLSENLDMPLLRYDMSEYQEKFNVSSLIGSPPGYVGFDDGQVGGGKLISDVSKNPYSIILFDEVEKAHPDVLNIMLQMLDDARITSSNGKTISLKNTIIIMTSNLGARDNEFNNIGFGTQLERTGQEDKAMKDFFKPELRNRIDCVCKFTKLDKLAIKKVVLKFIKILQESLDEKNIKLTLSEATIDLLADKGFDSKLGARPISRKIDELVKIPLSKKILFERLSNCSLYADVIDENIEFTVNTTLEHSPIEL